jgi:hypothetical protein
MFLAGFFFFDLVLRLFPHIHKCPFSFFFHVPPHNGLVVGSFFYFFKINYYKELANLLFI